MGKVVGIDLGTTFSAVAIIDENGNPQILQNKEGDRTTPSVVLFSENQAIVGKFAKGKSISEPSNYESCVKRHMGEKTYSFTNQKGEVYKAEEISGLILKKLKEDSEEALGDKITGAVITVPAYFADPQRQATKDAAKLAGIEVLDIINEPTAAAIAFGVSKNVSKKQRIMIYDFGGGTFDVSILDIEQGKIEVIATTGDHKLGGYDIDLAIYNYVKDAARMSGLNIERDKNAQQNLMIQAEEVKKVLSTAEKAEVCIYIRGEVFSIKIDRDTFDDEIADATISSTMSIMQRALDEAGISYDDIDKILLVGGSTRIPAVRALIEKESGIVPSSEVHPDEAVAIGAAYHAVEAAKRENENTGSKSDPLVEADIPEIENKWEFRDVTSHGIGIVVSDEISGEDINCVLMPKNTVIPAEIECNGFSTVAPYQAVIQLQVTQGEFENLQYTTIIGEAELNIRPREHIVPIKFIISCDENALIHVKAYDADENVDLGEIKIKRDEHNMTETEMREAENRIHRLNIG